MHNLWCLGSKFCLKFQRAPLKFHTNLNPYTENYAFYRLYFYVWITMYLYCYVINLCKTPPGTPTWNLDGINAGIILCMCPANERLRHNVTVSLIDRAHAQINPWCPILKCVNKVLSNGCRGHASVCKHFVTDQFYQFPSGLVHSRWANLAWTPEKQGWNMRVN